MPSDSTTDRHSTDEIEITPKMIEAGYDAAAKEIADLTDLNPREDVVELLVAVYKAMRRSSF